MADFYIIDDPDEHRVAEHARRSGAFLESLPYPIREEVEIDTARLVLLRNPPTPFDVTRADGRARAVDLGGGGVLQSAGPLPPADLEESWSRETPLGMLIQARPEGGVRIVADRLGIYPVYFLEAGDVFLAASSPSLIVSHPACKRAIDRIGLTGILLYSMPGGRRTIWESVKRLRPGEALMWSRRDGLRTEEVWHPRSVSVTLPDADPVDTFDRHFRTWVQSLQTPANLQLSGGLDSRIVAGYLSTKPGSVVEAWTYGEPRDYEASTARRAARVCGFRHRTVPVNLDRYVEWAHWTIDAGHLSNAVPDFGTWAIGDVAAKSQLPVVTGHLGDIVLGGNHIGRGILTSNPVEEFEILRGRLNHGYGLTEEQVVRLLRGNDGKDLIAACVAEFSDAYASYADDAFHRGWWFDLLHRDRLNVARLVLQVSRYSWPLIPYCLPRLVEDASVLDSETLRGRRLEHRIIVAHFPRLAAIPFDRGQLDLWPALYPSRISRLFWTAGERLRRAYRTVAVRKGAIERRVNHRLWSFDRNPGWQEIRRMARDGVGLIEDLVDVDYFKELVPSPGVPTDTGDALAGSGVKTAACLVLWAAAHR
ncbi:MAG TPA: asparagine synthase-related protein [Rhodothermales bacterium]